MIPPLPTTSAKLNAGVELKPAHSQVFVLALACIGIVPLVMFFAFLWGERIGSASVSSFLFLLIEGAAWYSWNISRRDIDMQKGIATEIKLGKNGDLHLLADPRHAPLTYETLTSLQQFLSVVQRRQPIPEADGIVDASNNPVPNTSAEAKKRVHAANKKAKEAAEILTGPVSEVSQEIDLRGTLQKKNSISKPPKESLSSEIKKDPNQDSPDPAAP